jgi:hypothetical protein
MVNAVEGYAGDFALAVPVEGHPPGTLVHVTLSPLHPSQLQLVFSERHPVLTDAYVLLCGHTGALKLLELGYTGPLARRPELSGGRLPPGAPTARPKTGPTPPK